MESFVADSFMCAVSEAERHRYKLTAAIAELHLGEIVNGKMQFSGLLYPTVKMWGNGDNLALLPEFVDRNVVFKKALHIRVDAKIENTLSISKLDAAFEFAEDGALKWLGRLPNFRLGPGQNAKAVGTAGRDQYGDYEIGQDGAPCHWVLIDAETGKIIEPS